ncbi:MAG: MFS transporter [Candidatus Faecousia sp.]|nr:MFS transporter [Candidatus Faecousia sp.]
MKSKFRLTPLERNWVLYDVGNSAFILLVSTLIPIYFNSLSTSGGLDESQYLAFWGYAGSVSTLLVAIIGPICGTLADQSGFKKKLFLVSVLVGVLGCAVLGAAGSWLSFLVVYVLAKVGYSSSQVFYDAMLPEITREDRMDNVSSMGYAFGYIGSVIPFVLCLLLVLFGDTLGLSASTAMVLSFLLVALWWLGCTLPLLKTYRQSACVERSAHPIRDTFRQLGQTFREASHEKHIFLYLLSFFFFIDGVYTTIDMATAYGTALGLDSTGLLLALLVTQIVAFPCAIVFGRLSATADTGKLIKLCILAYTGITVFAMFLKSQWQFWLLAVLVGMFQGGIQALSRSYLGKIIPPERSGEYFGLMDICGKGASFLGTTIIAVISQFTAGTTYHLLGQELQSQSIAVGALVILFAIGYILFRQADKLNKSRVH